MTFWGEGVRCGKPGLLRGSGVFSWPRRAQSTCVVASPGPSRSPWRGAAGRLLTRVQFANSMHMAPRSWELIALSLLAGLGFGLALDRGDLIFIAVFGAACGMAIVAGMQRFP